jgi:hypothetical protein
MLQGGATSSPRWETTLVPRRRRQRTLVASASPVVMPCDGHISQYSFCVRKPLSDIASGQHHGGMARRRCWGDYIIFGTISPDRGAGVGTPAALRPEQPGLNCVGVL